MTTKTIAAYSTGAYSIKAAYTALSITATGGFGGGVYAAQLETVFNQGKIGAAVTASATIGVNLNAGGVVRNGTTVKPGGTIGGNLYGVNLAAVGNVFNYGEIFSSYGTAITIAGAGTIVNGTASDTNALIEAAAVAVAVSGLAAVRNFGDIESSLEAGVIAYGGAVVTNGGPTDMVAKVVGTDGVNLGVFSGQGMVTNFGQISGVGTLHGQAGAVLSSGGVLTNGAATDHGAQVSGYSGVLFQLGGDVYNFGTILGLGSAAEEYGVSLAAGSKLTNGKVTDQTALISGANGVQVAGAVYFYNYGRIVGLDAAHGAAGLIAPGADGDFTNGAATDAAAVISGYNGALLGASDRFVNYGSVIGQGGAQTCGLSFSGGSSLFNRASGLIEGSSAVVSVDSTTINYGTIRGDLGPGIQLNSGGGIINGDAHYAVGLIEAGGGYAVAIQNGGYVVNFATIRSGAADAIYVRGSSRITNVQGALIQGDGGVDIGTNGSRVTIENSGVIDGRASIGARQGAASVVYVDNRVGGVVQGEVGVYLRTGLVSNLGSIVGASGPGGIGIEVVDSYYAGHPGIENGAIGDSRGLIEGYIGVEANGDSEITNFATIEGTGGAAVLLTSSSATLGVGAGSVFIGSVNGGGGTLDLLNGSGTLTGLLAGGSVTVSGSMASTTFHNFNGVRINGAASFALAGVGGTIGAGQYLDLYGTLAGAGTLTLAASDAVFEATSKLAVAKVNETTGSEVYFIAPSLTVSDVWTQSGGKISENTGDKISFTGTGNSFSGTLTGTGTIAFTGGTDTLSGATLSATSVQISGAAVTVSGAISLAKNLTVNASTVTVATAGATLSGVGTLALNNSAANVIVGATAASKLTNNARISGAGQLGKGSLVLVNNATGTINANLPTALVINTGASTLTNAGLIENTSTGGLTIAGAVLNTGGLTVLKGTLAVNGAVSGGGTVKVSGGTADFAGPFSENVTFTTTAGSVLELANSQGYTGQITGFSKTGASKLDLLDIASATAKATYSGTTASGVLTVTDGTHTAKINLTGDYTASTFTVGDDGHGGTTVVDPAIGGGGGRIQPLLAALAGFTPAGVEHTWPASAFHAFHGSTLAVPP